MDKKKIKLIIAFILGWIASILLAIAVIIDFFGNWAKGAGLEFLSFFPIIWGGAVILLLIGLTFVIKQKLYKGGTIILYTGGVSLFIAYIGGEFLIWFVLERFILYAFFTLLSSILAIISGSLIRREEYYERMISLDVEESKEHRKN